MPETIEESLPELLHIVVGDVGLIQKPSLEQPQRSGSDGSAAGGQVLYEAGTRSNGVDDELLLLHCNRSTKLDFRIKATGRAETLGLIFGPPAHLRKSGNLPALPTPSAGVTMSDKTPTTGGSSPQTTPHLAFTTISNVKLHVPVLLSFSEPNYKKWSRLFLLLVRRFSLADFLNGKSTPSSADDAEWFQLDALLQGWILSTVNDEVSDLVISSTNSASELWKSIYSLFHDNKPARAMQLEHLFRTTHKGSLSVATYCQTLKNIADWLDDVDAPVSEQQLVLQVLRGLPDEFRQQTSFLQFQTPTPTFLQVRSALLLIEQQRTDLGSSRDTPGTVLYSGSSSGLPFGTNSSRGSVRGSGGQNVLSLKPMIS
ncbi:unnamed protein product [Cuscuta campestris]|uniref:Retrotransposon gag domain-containing protein n=1 Tax=Cuscuta campestris TaxID=132261 RepID=A0A484L1X7_9ASTE|nr:unnamed protein product [Cuscuta campestris]